MELPWHYLLECPVQKYEWGNNDPKGIIQTLLAGHNPLPEGATAAELWMGAHPSASSRLMPEGTELFQAIAQNPGHFLGPVLADRGFATLPFLFKVLDARRPLSIQAHPDKAGAERLHRLDPAHYPDDNHKPEVAICLRDLRALIGFRPAAHIKVYLEKLSELKRLCDPPADMDPEVDPKRWIRTLYGNLMRSTPDRIDSSARFLLRREEKGFVVENQLFRSLVNLFGTRDPGIFSVFFLNFVELRFGEAIYLGPNEPHAYLSGQILECMAASDNVVRAGLTGKHIDVETLLGMLHYTPGLPAVKTPTDHGVFETYDLPVSDFQVQRWHCSGEPAWIGDHARPSIFLLLQGGAIIMADGAPGGGTPANRELTQGQVLFLPGDLAARGIRVAFSGSRDTVLYQATVGPEF